MTSFNYSLQFVHHTSTAPIVVTIVNVKMAPSATLVQGPVLALPDGKVVTARSHATMVSMATIVKRNARASMVQNVTS